jgi:hypothetical protein
MDGSHVRTLQEALKALRDKERLATALGIPQQDLEHYLAGIKPLPHQLFIEALDIVASGRSR